MRYRDLRELKKKKREIETKLEWCILLSLVGESITIGMVLDSEPMKGLISDSINPITDSPGSIVDPFFSHSL